MDIVSAKYIMRNLKCGAEQTAEGVGWQREMGTISVTFRNSVKLNTVFSFTVG